MKTHYERRGPAVAFDDTLPEGVDPDANWRHANGTGHRRGGSTAAERAGQVPDYTPGYGRSSAQNSYGASSLTRKAAWDEGFTPHLGPQMGQTPAAPPAVTPPPAVPPVLPPAASPTALPVLPPSPGATGATPSVPPMPSGPAIQQLTGTDGGATVRQVTGLPSGQRASATFIPGQNSKDNLAKRTRPPVDPLS